MDEIDMAIAASEKLHKALRAGGKGNHSTREIQKWLYTLVEPLEEAEEALTALRALKERQAVDVEALKRGLCAKAYKDMDFAHNQFGTLADYPTAEIWIKNTVNDLAAQGYLTAPDTIAVKRENAERMLIAYEHAIHRMKGRAIAIKHSALEESIKLIEAQKAALADEV